MKIKKNEEYRSKQRLSRLSLLFQILHDLIARWIVFLSTYLFPSELNIISIFHCITRSMSILVAWIYYFWKLLQFYFIAQAFQTSLDRSRFSLMSYYGRKEKYFSEMSVGQRRHCWELMSDNPQDKEEKQILERGLIFIQSKVYLVSLFQ